MVVTEAQLSNSDNSSKRKRPTWYENLSFYFTECCENTSIHGVKFLGERGRSVFEKIWWLVFLGISLYFCIILINKVYQKWESSPVIVTFATTQTPIWKIPFPSVTICSAIKTNKGIYNFTREVLLSRNKTDMDRERFNNYGHMCLICRFGGIFNNNFAYITDETAIDFLIKVAPKCEDNIFQVKWLGKEYNLKDNILTPTLTSEGMCYTFNLLDRKEIFTEAVSHYKDIGSTDKDSSQWDPDKDYNENAGLESFPRRTFLSGVNGGLNIILKTKVEEIDPLCGESIPGFKIMIQDPSELPTANEHYFRVPLNQDVMVAIKPNMMTTSDDLRSYKPEDRQCFFLEEKKLRFFKMYNQPNCLLECLANFTYRHCDCVAFYMPRDNTTSICGYGMYGCIRQANEMFLSQETARKLNNTRKMGNKLPKSVDEDLGDNCNCLPLCTSLQFEIETSQSDWDWRATFALLNITDFKDYHLSKVRIFFKDMQFITSVRNELYGQTDFWANCGGLLGLFTGFSFISMVEILYYLTLRLICNLRKFGRHYWSGAKELMEKED